jgi:ABC-type branched-subunit amino acid transport system permease subunit
MASWHQAKLFLEHLVAISNDALHVIIGVVVQLVIALVLKWSVSSVRPVLVVLALAAWNEIVDLWTERWPEPGMQYGECAKDVAVTILLPLVLMFAARLRPELFRGSRRRR